MQFQHYDLGYVEARKIVEVTLGYSANVRILTSTNYANFKAGRRHQFIGGNVTKSPFRATLPTSGTWFVVVDLGGYSGKIKSSVKVL